MADDEKRGKLILLPGGGDSGQELSRRHTESMLKEMREHVEALEEKRPVAFAIVTLNSNGSLGLRFHAENHHFELIAGLEYLKQGLME